MAYTPTVWTTGDVVTSEKLNKLENAIVGNVKDVSGTYEYVLEDASEPIIETFNNAIIENDLENNVANAPYAHAEGVQTTASGAYAHAEGGSTIASGNTSHAEGNLTTASGDYSHAEGNFTTASGGSSHAEGQYTIASGDYSHAEGATYNFNQKTINEVTYTKATAVGQASHIEGTNNLAIGHASHAEGGETIASGEASHAEGIGTIVNGQASHVEGFQTIASGTNQHVFGKYNVEDNLSTYCEIVGIGNDEISRKNGRTLDWNGNEKLTGSLTLGAGTANEVTLTPETLRILLNMIPTEENQ